MNVEDDLVGLGGGGLAGESADHKSKFSTGWVKLGGWIIFDYNFFNFLN